VVWLKIKKEKRTRRLLPGSEATKKKGFWFVRNQLTSFSVCKDPQGLS